MAIQQTLPAGLITLKADRQSKQHRRIYHRMNTGLQIAWNQQADMRFLTLTTAKQRVLIKHGKRKGRIRTLRESWQILRQRIARARIGKDGFNGFKMNKYYCLRTAEGNGVLHIVFWGGRYIPQHWIRNNWLDIHGAYETRIEYIHKKRQRVNGIVAYLLDNYLYGQPVERMSYGWNWAWLGFCKSWKRIKDIYGIQGLRRGKGQFNPPKGLWKFKDRKDYTQSVPFWRGVLTDPPHTSRQTKWFYPNRGWNSKYLVIPEGG